MLNIYTKKNCIWCDRAKELLNKTRLEYDDHILGEDFDTNFIRNAFPTMMTYPIIVQDQNLIGGYAELAEKMQHDPYFGKHLLLE